MNLSFDVILLPFELTYCVELKIICLLSAGITSTLMSLFPEVATDTSNLSFVVLLSLILNHFALLVESETVKYVFTFFPLFISLALFLDAAESSFIFEELFAVRTY